MLFKKLNEQIELNNTLSGAATIEEQEKVEKNLLFNDLLENIIEDLQISEAKNA